MNQKNNRQSIRIGIDGNEANLESRVGVNQYAFQLLKNFSKLQDKKKDIAFEIFLRLPPRSDLPPEREGWHYTVLPGGGMWILRKLMPHLLFKRPKIDVFFAPSHYLPPLAHVPMVCSIMDLGYLKFSEQFKKYDYWQLRLWSAMSLLRAKKVLAISETTKKDIVRHYPYTSNKVIASLLGYDDEEFNVSIPSADVRHVKDLYTMGKDYVLFLGTLKPSKNILGLIEAWAQVEKKFKDVVLVIAGKKGWLYDSFFQKIKDLGVKDRVIFTDFFPEGQKAPLIRGARAFILPSFWEGFGLDVVSAMACGVPVIVSDRGSLVEVVGNAGLIVNPEDTDSIAKAIEDVLSLPKKQYNMIVEKGLRRSKDFSWEKTARETLEVLIEAKKN